MVEQPLSQVEIEQEIVRISALSERAVTELARRAVSAAEADAAYRVAHAQAYLMTSGKTVNERESQAMLECADERLAAKIAEAMVLGATEAARSYRAQLSALQTLASNQRALITGG